MSDQKYTRQVIKMHASTWVTESREQLKDLERAEIARGRSQQEARAFVARAIGVASGTLDNLRNGRLKSIRIELYEVLRQAAVSHLSRQIEALSNELAIAQASDPNATDGAIRQAENVLAQARQVIAQTKATR